MSRHNGSKKAETKDIEGNVNLHGEPALHVEVLPPAPDGGLKARGDSRRLSETDEAVREGSKPRYVPA